MTQLNQKDFKNKVVADFGCGPRGSLAWLNNAKMKLGIDVNVDLYADECFRPCYGFRNYV